MNRIKRKKVYFYEDLFEYYDLRFYLKALPILSADGHKEYQVSIHEYDQDSNFMRRESIHTPQLVGKTPQIAFSEAKKYIRSIYTPDPVFVELEESHKKFLRRVDYEQTKKKKPYAPSQTKS